MSAPERTGPYQDRAVVLRTYRLGEADRIVVMLGEAHGRIRGVAKGVRRARSRFGARLEPASCLNVRLWRGRGDLDTITSVQATDAGRALREHLSLRENLTQLSRAMAMLEAVERLALDRTPSGELYHLLVRGLRSLYTHPSELSVGAFLWKLVQLEGIAPDTERCASCGEGQRLVAFDPQAAGLTCIRCWKGSSLRSETLRLIEGILEGRTSMVLAHPPGRAAKEFERTAVQILEMHIERRLRVPNFLNSVSHPEAILPSDACSTV